MLFSFSLSYQGAVATPTNVEATPTWEMGWRPSDGIGVGKCLYFSIEMLLMALLFVYNTLKCIDYSLCYHCTDA